MFFLAMFGIKHRRPFVHVSLMPARRLEDRIRELCARLLIEEEPKWSVTAQNLQLALQEHTLRIKHLATAVLVAGKPVIERRKR
jgi:hypothetical protein